MNEFFRRHHDLWIFINCLFVSIIIGLGAFFVLLSNSMTAYIIFIVIFFPASFIFLFWNTVERPRQEREQLLLSRVGLNRKDFGNIYSVRTEYGQIVVEFEENNRYDFEMVRDKSSKNGWDLCSSEHYDNIIVKFQRIN